MRFICSYIYDLHISMIRLNNLFEFIKYCKGFNNVLEYAIVKNVDQTGFDIADLLTTLHILAVAKGIQQNTNIRTFTIAIFINLS